MRILSSAAAAMVAAGSMARASPPLRAAQGTPTTDAVPAVAPDWCRDPPPAAFATLERVDTTQSWFDVYRIRPGIFALYEPRQYEQVISYLMVGERRALLFDTGLGVGDIAALVHTLTPLPVTVLNSHTHFDHIGGNADFDDVWNEDTPFSRANARGVLDDYARATFDPDRLCGPLPPQWRDRPYALRPYAVTHRVHDGERIELGGRSLEILYTPGHAPDSLCLLDRAHGLLFTGDTFYIGPIYLFAPRTDLDAYARSVARIAALVPGLELLLPAHTVPVAAPARLTALQDAVQQVRAGELRPVLAEGHREYRFGDFSLLLAPE